MEEYVVVRKHSYAMVNTGHVLSGEDVVEAGIWPTQRGSNTDHNSFNHLSDGNMIDQKESPCAL